VTISSSASGADQPPMIVPFVMLDLVNYTADQYLFLAILFPLALAWGYIMQKTDRLWGSILFNAGMDIPIMLGIFSNRYYSAQLGL
jgi:membrane protease YdiL (CAAX protease family)